MIRAQVSVCVEARLVAGDVVTKDDDRSAIESTGSVFSRTTPSSGANSGVPASIVSKPR